MNSLKQDFDLLHSSANAYLEANNLPTNDIRSIDYMEAAQKRKVAIKKKKKATDDEPEEKATPKKRIIIKKNKQPSPSKEAEPIVHEDPAETFDVTKETPDPEDLPDGVTGAIEDIKDIIAKNLTKRGKKPADYTIIKELSEKGYNKVAQYLGAFLARYKTSKPYWTALEIKDALENKSFISEKFLPAIESQGDIAEEDAKRIAAEIKTDIFKNISDFTKQINDILKSKPSGDYKVPQVYTPTQLKSKLNAIINGLEMCEENGTGIDLNYNPEQHNMFAFIHTLVMDLYRNMHLVKLHNDEEEDAQIRAERNKVILQVFKELDEIEQNPLLFVDYDEPITSIEDLKKYFTYINSIEVQGRGEKLVAKYASQRKKAQANIHTETQTSGTWDMDSLHALLLKLAIKLQIQSTNTTESGKTISKIAHEIAKVSPQLIEFIEKEYGTEDGEGELAGLIAANAYKRENALGRKRGDIAHSQADDILNKVLKKVRIAD